VQKITYNKRTKWDDRIHQKTPLDPGIPVENTRKPEVANLKRKTEGRIQKTDPKATTKKAVVNEGLDLRILRIHLTSRNPDTTRIKIHPLNRNLVETAQNTTITAAVPQEKTEVVAIVAKGAENTGNHHTIVKIKNTKDQEVVEVAERNEDLQAVLPVPVLHQDLPLQRILIKNKVLIQNRKGLKVKKVLRET